MSTLCRISMSYSSNTVLSCSDSRILNFVQTFQNITCRELGHRQWNFVPSRIEVLNIIIANSSCEQSSEIKYGVRSASDSKVVVDHVNDLSSAKEPILFLSFLFLQTDLLFEVGILDDLVQSRSNSRVQHLKIRAR